ncbi:MAG: hypothetical protein CMM02_06510, partial [Rhodopirellula sp.]|nr:hypothetical protein [Rhodopirellula sp.]
ATALQDLNDDVPLMDTFTYTVSDAQGETAVGIVSIDVTGIDDQPEAHDDQVNATRTSIDLIDLIKADSPSAEGHDFDRDIGDEIVKINIQSQPTFLDANGVSIPVGSVADPNGVEPILYTLPNEWPENFDGKVTFDYTVEDGDGIESEPATVTVLVNDPPVANDDSVEVYKNQQKIIDVIQAENTSYSGHDYDVDGTIEQLTIIAYPDPTHGLLVENPDKTVTFTPAQDYLGAAEFKYQLADDDGDLSEIATVSIDVLLDPIPWHNRGNGMDVNGDTKVSPIDALVIISELNEKGSYLLPVETATPPPFFDVNQNGYVDSGDAIVIINHLNALANGEGEFVEPTAMDISEVSQKALDVGETHANNGFAVDNLQTFGLSQVRSEIIEELIDELADEVSEVLEDSDEISLDDFFGQF